MNNILSPSLQINLQSLSQYNQLKISINGDILVAYIFANQLVLFANVASKGKLLERSTVRH